MAYCSSDVFLSIICGSIHMSGANIALSFFLALFANTLFLVSLTPFPIVQITFTCIKNKTVEVYLNGGCKCFSLCDKH